MTRVVVQNINDFEEKEYRRFRNMVSEQKRERLDICLNNNRLQQY